MPSCAAPNATKVATSNGRTRITSSAGIVGGKAQAAAFLVGVVGRGMHAGAAEHLAGLGQDPSFGQRQHQRPGQFRFQRRGGIGCGHAISGGRVRGPLHQSAAGRKVTRHGGHQVIDRHGATEPQQGQVRAASHCSCAARLRCSGLAVLSPSAHSRKVRLAAAVSRPAANPVIASAAKQSPPRERARRGRWRLLRSARKKQPPPPLEGGGWGEGFVPLRPLPPTPSLKGRGSLLRSDSRGGFIQGGSAAGRWSTRNDVVSAPAPPRELHRQQRRPGGSAGA